MDKSPDTAILLMGRARRRLRIEAPDERVRSFSRVLSTILAGCLMTAIYFARGERNHGGQCFGYVPKRAGHPRLLENTERLEICPIPQYFNCSELALVVGRRASRFPTIILPQWCLRLLGVDAKTTDDGLAGTTSIQGPLLPRSLRRYQVFFYPPVFIWFE